jgi:large subunit ribosomal protein L16
MLAPKREKFRKQFRGTMAGKSYRGSMVSFGDYGLKAMACGWLSAKHIEAGRKVLTKYTQKGGRVWIRVFPDKPISDKPPEVRMGSGKGDVVDHVAVIRPGKILFEMSGVSEQIAQEAMRKAASKLPFKSKYVKRK